MKRKVFPALATFEAIRERELSKIQGFIGGKLGRDTSYPQPCNVVPLFFQADTGTVP
jgi:hypothetical protein